MRLHYIQHVWAETPGVILDWAAERGWEVGGTFTFSEDPSLAALPSLDDFDLLVVMGGPMNVYEEGKYPWLAPEKAFLREAALGGKAVVGLCLGAQLLAAALGGKVERNAHKEIGWFPVTLTPEALGMRHFAGIPERPLVFQWHGDTFSELPPGAALLAAGEVCRNQAFRFRERAFAFQFHWENTRETISAFLATGGEELAEGGAYVQTPEEMLRDERIRESNRWMRGFLDALERDLRGGAGGITLEPVLTGEDAAALFPLVERIWREVFPPIIGEAQTEYMLRRYQSRSDIEREIAGGTRYFTVEREGKPIGYLAYEPRKEHLFISKVYLVKEERGRGLSSALFERLEEAARAEGKDRLHLHVNRGNALAIAVYRRKGFEVVQETVTDIGGGFVMDDLFMEKAL